MAAIAVTPPSQFTDPLAQGLKLLLLFVVMLHPLARVAVGTVAEVRRVVEAAHLGVVVPAQVVALVGDVALVHPALQTPQVQPHLVVLERRTNTPSGTHTHTHTNSDVCLCAQ